MQILIVEDNPDILELVNSFNNPFLITAENAALGIGLMERIRFDVVYCDYHGIAANGANAVDVIRYCRDNDIRCEVTSSDPLKVDELCKQFSIKSIDKYDMLAACKIS